MEVAIFAERLRGVNSFVQFHRMPGNAAAPPARVRLDKWLWAARFFKTRSAAAQAVDGGKVDINGERAKRAHLVQPGETITVRRPPHEHVVVVRGLSDVRGPAPAAAALYEETAASKQARETLAFQLKNAPTLAFDGGGRPTKRDRRDIQRVKQKW
jgi:ribosome-associated heat shock protein Hsp15